MPFSLKGFPCSHSDSHSNNWTSFIALASGGKQFVKVLIFLPSWSHPRVNTNTKRAKCLVSDESSLLAFDLWSLQPPSSLAPLATKANFQHLTGNASRGSVKAISLINFFLLASENLLALGIKRVSDS